MADSEGKWGWKSGRNQKPQGQRRWVLLKEQKEISSSETPTPFLITPSLHPVGFPVYLSPVPLIPLPPVLSVQPIFCYQEMGPHAIQTTTCASQLATLAPGGMYLQAQLRGRNKRRCLAPPNTMNSALLSALLTCSRETKPPSPPEYRSYRVFSKEWPRQQVSLRLELLKDILGSVVLSTSTATTLAESFIT